MLRLKKELETVTTRFATVIAKDKTTEPEVLFTPRERQMKNNSGKQEDNQTVDEFIEDI